MGGQDAQLILESVPSWQVPYVVKQRPKSREFDLLRSEFRIQIPGTNDVPGPGVLWSAVAVERLDHQVSNVKRPERVLESHVRCPAVDQVRLTELEDLAETLKGGVIDDSDLARPQPDLTMDRDEDLLLPQLAGVIR